MESSHQASHQAKVEVSKVCDGVHQILIRRGIICGTDCSLDYGMKNDENEKFKKIVFTSCKFCNFPKPESLFEFFPKLESLRIEHSKLNRISSMDLKGFEQLVDLFLENNGIEMLSGDLFQHTPNLQRISFASNKIRAIDEEVLEPLKCFKVFNLCFNPAIDVCFHYQAPFASDAVTLKDFKDAIKRCKPVQQVWEIVFEQKEELESLNQEIGKLKEIIHNQAARIETIGFAVVVKGKNFKVQKEILAANSQLLAKLIKENEDADTLELKDISEKTFELILNFMHTKRPPNSSENYKELYAASACLEMVELKDLCAKELKTKLTPANSLEILNLCEKFENIELQKKAHEEYKKKL